MHPMIMAKVIADIIELKKKHNLLEDNWTPQKQAEWLQYAIPMGLVVVMYVDGKIKGYLEYVRVDEIPTDIHNVKIDYDRIRTAPIGLVTNVIADDYKVLLFLKRQALNNNPDVEMIRWHKKSHKETQPEWKTFKRRKQ